MFKQQWVRVVRILYIISKSSCLTHEADNSKCGAINIVKYHQHITTRAHVARHVVYLKSDATRRPPYTGRIKGGRKRLVGWVRYKHDECSCLAQKLYERVKLTKVRIAHVMFCAAARVTSSLLNKFIHLSGGQVTITMSTGDNTHIYE